MSVKQAIVTGGASGIGREISLQLQSNGFEVTVLDLNKPDFDCTFKCIDVCDSAALSVAISEHKNLHVLVNNAGVYVTKDIERLSEADIDKTFDINVKAAFLTTQFALPVLRKLKGCVVNICSALALKPEAYSPAYCASKAALLMFTKCAALSEGSYGVRFNAVLPGPIDTPLLREFFDGDIGVTQDSCAEALPLKRLGQPEDVAQVVCFLVSEKARFVTGAAYTVDGGEAID